VLKLLAAAAILAPSLALVESRRLEKTEVDRAIRKGITALKGKPRVRVVAKARNPNDNSNSSYAALGLRPQFPAWRGTPGRWLGEATGSIQGLKDACWKGIVSASYTK
jgi:hypothetical protein